MKCFDLYFFVCDDDVHISSVYYARTISNSTQRKEQYLDWLELKFNENTKAYVSAEEKEDEEWEEIGRRRRKRGEREIEMERERQKRREIYYHGADALTINI
ncbi:hypothetical protein PoB_006757500 [Plakobranchus ocellatus]|uniref:Uncharacterized protein n=1 Tax=Plakobranchus ocellatus TaxID=259542 RepID=A0AAV4DAT8_9GAST|nr:hypothetical protein PoB_006757500 [Plakobranchus ocellatus]